ncbi:FAD-dependent oxidoreductase [Nocardioides sp. ChNu-153]|nr:FAD-dependent oxidoreductase [Nocardioides sp. ChNu-153]
MLVRGAGIVGLAVAEELQRRGHVVLVVDPAPGSGASHAAAGMLAPGSEVWWGEEGLLALTLRSAALWPAYAARLGVPLHRAGTLLVGHDRGDLQDVERQVALLRSLGGTATLLDRAALRRAEPSLGRVAGGALLPDDRAGDPRRVVAALRARVRVEPAATGWDHDVAVVATGARLPPPHAHLVRGVRGEVLRLRTDDPPRHVVRGWVAGEPVYVVPRPREPGAPDPGVEVVVGATSEEHDGPPVVTAGGVARLLEAARVLLPGLDRAELVEATARDRPTSADHLPLVGPAPPADGPVPAVPVVLAAGHFRHGVLLAPLTARLVADHLATGHVEPLLDPRRTDHHARTDPEERHAPPHRQR